MLLTHTLGREKSTFRGACQQKEGGLIFLRAGESHKLILINSQDTLKPSSVLKESPIREV